MPTITIDENSKQILKKVKKILQTIGINASYSDAIRELDGKPKNKS